MALRRRVDLDDPDPHDVDLSPSMMIVAARADTGTRRASASA